MYADSITIPIDASEITFTAWDSFFDIEPSVIIHTDGYYETAYQDIYAHVSFKITLPAVSEYNNIVGVLRKNFRTTISFDKSLTENTNWYFDTCVLVDYSTTGADQGIVDFADLEFTRNQPNSDYDIAQKIDDLFLYFGGVYESDVIAIQLNLHYRAWFYRTGTTGNGHPHVSYTNPNTYFGFTDGNFGFTGYRFKSLEQLDLEILQALRSGDSSVISAINNASSQAHSDAQTSQSQAADLIDDINYDHSGTSQSVSATQSAYDAAQGAADTAVDAAVHNYSSDLSTVEAYDYSTFFTSQRNSAVFWRDVGEYILDSSNLGFVSGSVIIVTLIGLVIFMLRL